MSCDSTDDEMYLTPKGWVHGTSYIYGKTDKVIERPSDAVETWVRHMRQSYSMAPEHVSWECIWMSNEYTESERAAIEKKYPLKRW